MNVHATAGTGESGLASKPWERGPDGYPRGECWYVVEARGNSVESAYDRLAVAGFVVWMAVDVRRSANRQRGAGRRRRDVRVPRFGRFFYLRSALDARLQHEICGTSGVVGMLRGAGSETPTPVPAEVIEWLRRIPVGRPCENRAKFSVGDIVRLTDGPFAGFEAAVEYVDKRGLLRLDVSIFGRPTPIVLEVGHVELVRAGQAAAIKTYCEPAGSDSRGVRKHS